MVSVLLWECIGKCQWGILGGSVAGLGRECFRSLMESAGLSNTRGIFCLFYYFMCDVMVALLF